MSVLERQLALLEADLGASGSGTGSWRDRRTAKHVKKRRLEIAAEEQRLAEADRSARKARNLERLTKERPESRKLRAFERLQKEQRPVVDASEAEAQLEEPTLFNFEDDELVEKEELQSVEEENSGFGEDADSDSDSDGEVKIFRFPEEP